MVKVLKALALLLVIYLVVFVAKVDAADIAEEEQMMRELELKNERKPPADHEPHQSRQSSIVASDNVEGLMAGNTATMGSVDEMQSQEAPADAAPQFFPLPRMISDPILNEHLTSSERSAVATVSKSWQWKEWPKGD